MKLLIRALVVLVLVTCASAFDLRFDTCTMGVDGFGQTQLDHLNWVSPNGHALAMPSDAKRLDIQGNGNTYTAYYDTLTNQYSTSGQNATTAAANINSYVQTNCMTTGPKPTYLVLNEISSGLWPDTPTYRAWLRGTVSQLKNTYGYTVLLLAPFANPQQNGADWAPLSQDCYIVVENYLSGLEMKNNGFSVTWAQQQYLSSITSYTARGVDPSRLFLAEEFQQTDATKGWGRAGVTADEWRTAIAARNDAIRNVGFTGFLGYAWSHNDLGAPLADLLSFEDTYRSHIVVETEGPQWNKDANGSWATAANWTSPFAPVPPSQMSEVANFVKALTAPRTVSLDGSKTIGRMTLDSAIGYTISQGSGGSLTFSNNGLPGSLTVVQGSHTILAPVILSDAVNLKINGGGATLSGALNNSAGNTLTKTGTGAVTIAGVQAHGAGAIFNANAGSTAFSSDAAATGARNLTLNVNGGSLAFGSTQHLLALNVAATATVNPSFGSSYTIVTGSISVSGGGKLDMTSNDLIVDYTSSSPLSTIQSMITAGYSNGSWTGNGITSSAAAATAGSSFKSALGVALSTDLFTSFPASFVGQNVDSTAVLVRYTAYGDANLDGTVDTTDFNLLAANFAQSGKRWFNGDFTYNGMVDTTDFNLLTSNFGTTLPAEAGSPAVPEPGVMSVAWMVGLLMLRRRSIADEID